MAIAKRFDTLVRGRIIAEKLSTPVHLEQSTRAPIAIQSVVQQSILETLSHTHANLARGKHSTARLTIRRAHATLMSAIGSTRWSRAVSVLTPRITGCGGMIDHTKNRGYRIPVHAIVSTRVVFLPLCNVEARPRRVVLTRESLSNRIPCGNRESVLTRWDAVDLLPEEYRRQFTQSDQQWFPLRFNLCASVSISGS